MTAVVGDAPAPLSTDAAWRLLLRMASDAYRSAGRYARHFAAGKLRFDPVFRHLLSQGLIPPNSRVLDIGCGQGLLGSLLRAAERAEAEGAWPADWPAAPAGVRLTGIELSPRDAARAQVTLGTHAELIRGDMPETTFPAPNVAQITLSAQTTVICGDMCETTFPASDVVVILDVLHYVALAEQDRVLARVRQALCPGGQLLLRVGDASRRAAARHSFWVDRLVNLLRGQRELALTARPLLAWQQQLESLGFQVQAHPMSQGTPFANVLLVAHLPSGPLPRRGRVGVGAHEAPLPHAKPPFPRQGTTPS